MTFKKIICSYLAIMLTFSLCSVSVFAQTEESKESFTLVDSSNLMSTLRGADTEESWGWGHLYSKKPIFSNAEGYAVTAVKDGSAYKVGAKVSVKNKDGSVDALEETINTDMPSATSGTILAKSSTGTFYGKHRIQMKKTSGWQTCDTSWTP